MKMKHWNLESGLSGWLAAQEGRFSRHVVLLASAEEREVESSEESDLVK